MIDSKALEAATLAAFSALYPQAKWEDIPKDSQESWTRLTMAAIEEYQRATLKGYAEKIERKGF